MVQEATKKMLQDDGVFVSGESALEVAGAVAGLAAGAAQAMKRAALF